MINYRVTQVLTNDTTWWAVLQEGEKRGHSQMIANSKRPRQNFYRCTIIIRETKKKQQLTHYDKLSSKTSFDKRYHMVGSLARRRKAWFHLRRNRMLFAAKHS